MESERKITGHRDASFSCYLTTPAEISSFAAKLTEPAADIASPEENGIGVFRAEKYFNTRHEDAHKSPRIIDTLTGKYVHESDTIDPRRRQHKRQQQVVVGTPSESSEASSTTTQSTFLNTTSLRNSSSSSSSSLRGSSREKRPFFPAFPCRGSCSAKKSLPVSTKQAVGAKVALGHSNPANWEGRKVQSKSRFQNPTVITQLVAEQEQEEEEEEEEGRKSLEFFGSRSMKKEEGIIAMDLERKLSVLTWDAIPNPQQQQQTKQTVMIKPKPMKREMVYDGDSDASSDLFEIETVSGPMFTKQDEGGCVTPTSRYAPSEVSVEWSVVTASAADFSFAASEYGDYHNKMAAGSGMRPNSAANAAKGRKSSNGNGGGILSCKSLKAVEVAETVVVHKEKLYSAPQAASKQKVTGR